MSRFIESIFPKAVSKIKEEAQSKAEVEALNNFTDYMQGLGLGEYYSGEKSLGQAPAAIEIEVDYYDMALRAWNLYLKSDFAQTLISKTCLHIFGTGLTLEVSPKNKLLKENGYPEITTEVKQSIEAMYKAFKKDIQNTYHSETSIDKLIVDSVGKALIEGDVLFTMYIDKGRVKVRVFDGYSVCDDNSGSSDTVNGVEYDKDTGDVLSYHIILDDGKTKKIDAYTYITDKIRVRSAFLVKSPLNGLKTAQRRGLSMFSAILEKASKHERYSEATVSGAEKISNYPIAFEHDATSTGQDPLKTDGVMNKLKKFNSGSSYDLMASNGVQNVNVSQESTALNLPAGAKVKYPDQRFTTQYTEFSDGLISQMIGVVSMPLEIFKSMYNSNYTAARAAINDWEFALTVLREYFSSSLENLIYEYWVFYTVLSNEVKLPQLTMAIKSDDTKAVEYITAAVLKSSRKQNLDPKKEAEALRIILGENMRKYPIQTISEAMIMLGNNGDYDTSVEKIKTELDTFKSVVDSVDKFENIEVIDKKEEDK